MKEVKLSLDTAKALYQQGGASKLFALDNYTEEEINRKELLKKFEDLGVVDAFYLSSSYGDIRKVQVATTLKGKPLVALPTESLAKAVIALCKLLFLRDAYNGSWKPDWKNSYPKCVIEIRNCDISVNTYSSTNRILAFKTSEIRNEFLKNFKDLIEEAKELL